MKKIALSLAVLFAVGMVSCGGHKEKECEDTCAQDTAVVVEEGVAVVEDTTGAVDTVNVAEVAAAETPAAE